MVAEGLVIITLKLVELVHRFAVIMGSYGVIEVRTGADELVGGMVNATSLALGSVTEFGGSGGGDLCQ